MENKARLHSSFSKLVRSSLFRIYLASWLLFFIVTCFTSFHIGRDDCLAEDYFICFHFIKPKKGQIIIVDRQNTKYLHGASFAKRMMGVAGDEIKIKEGILNVGGNIIGPFFYKTTGGEVLTPIKEGIIPKNYVFVAGTHSKSFDSRYQEFGLVHIDNIKGTAYGF